MRLPSENTRQTFRKRLREGALDDKEIEIEVADTGASLGGLDIPGMPGASVGMINIGDIFGKAMGGRTLSGKQ